MEKFYYYAPVILIVVFEASYQMAAKGMPSANNVFANLVWVYLTSAVLSVALFFATNKSGGSLMSEMSGTNWAPFVLGTSIVGFEFGFVMLYRVGWEMSVGSTFCNMLVALLLIAIGALVYKDQITFSKLLGVALCAGGLFFLNR